MTQNLSAYLPAIHAILDKSDLSTVSAKAVRKELKIQYPDLDIKLFKTELDQLTAQAFQAINSKPTPVPPVSSSSSKPKSKPKRERSYSDEEDQDTYSHSTSYSGRKQKTATSSTSSASKVKRQETDEELAQRLHAELNGMRGGRSRVTRGAVDDSASFGSSAKKGATWNKKKRGKKDDAGSDDGDGKKKKRKTSNTGYNKLHALSSALAEIVGAEAASRPQCTKKIWEYVKAHNLQKPGNGMFILPDSKLREVFPFNEIHGFKLAKHLTAHLYPMEGNGAEHKNGDFVDDDEEEDDDSE
ncbi:hypothetical protein T439DRAFT_40907 [Meredithblackwellia eburnea MCA 4105]